MQKRTILAMLAGLAIAAPIVGAQQQATAKPAIAGQHKAATQAAATTGQQKAKATTVAKSDSGKAVGAKASAKVSKMKAKRHKKAS
ncbi:MAG: hypothetical protein MNPFHGCM_00677 [Gemmatimonadaceae bacterium]|nr:hypothetical protein [Gemmatimonadaceae bacterium]